MFCEQWHNDRRWQSRAGTRDDRSVLNGRYPPHCGPSIVKDPKSIVAELCELAQQQLAGRTDECSRDAVISEVGGICFRAGRREVEKLQRIRRQRAGFENVFTRRIFNGLDREINHGRIEDHRHHLGDGWYLAGGGLHRQGDVEIAVRAELVGRIRRLARVGDAAAGRRNSRSWR